MMMGVRSSVVLNRVGSIRGTSSIALNALDHRESFKSSLVTLDAFDSVADFTIFSGGFD